MVDSANMRFAEVAVDVPTAPGRTFSYRVPNGVNILPGQLVRVPFGARTLQGVVFSLGRHSQVSEAETKDIAGPVFDEPLLVTHRVSFSGLGQLHFLCKVFHEAHEFGKFIRPGAERQIDMVHPQLGVARNVLDQLVHAWCSEWQHANL